MAMGKIKDCSEVVSKLYESLDGELTEERKLVIREHLDECSPCLEAFEFETELRAMVSSKSREICPEHLKNKIADLINVNERNPQSSSE